MICTQARSFHSNMSFLSIDSNLRSNWDDGQLERAMDDIDKAKLRSMEQRVRSFCNAAASGSIQALSRLLQTGIDVNGTDANGRYVS